MFLRWVGVVMLAGALVVPGNVQAGHGHGGGHGGGGFSHGGGGFAHGGFAHGGFAHGGFGLGYYPGFYGGYGWGGYYPYSYAVPAYSEPYVVPSYSNMYTPPPAYTDAPVPTAPGSSITAEPGSIAPTTYTSANTALVEILVPANAEVWIEGDKTQQTGEDRHFQSPPLQPDHKYSYDVKARWMDSGRLVEKQRTVPVLAGERAVVDFRKP